MNFSEAYTDRCSSVGHAARSGDIKSLKKLIKKGSSVDVPDNRGWMPIHEAAFSNSAQCLQLLITSAPSKSYIQSKTFEGESALHLAAKCGSIWCTELLLRAGADPNVVTNDETTPLFLAVEAGGVDVVTLLLEYKANINGSHSCSGWNPLHQASLMERTDLMQLLLENGVDKECVDDFGITPLFIAAQYGKFESLSLLLSQGADVNCQAKDKATALFIAAQEGHEKCAELLLSKGASPNRFCNDDAWQLPIHAAAEMGRSNILKMLIAVTDRGIDTRSDRASPVYSAVYGGQKECLEILLAAGYSPKAQECRCFDCLTPMCMVIQKGRTELAPLLLKYGLELSRSHLDSCLRYNSFPLFRYFLRAHCPLSQDWPVHAAGSDLWEWVPYLLLAGLEPTHLLPYSWIHLDNRDLTSFIMEFTDWRNFSPNGKVDKLRNCFAWIPNKHFTSIPPLMHLCRLKIRSLLKTDRLRSNKYICQLELPDCLHEYLQYSDVFRVYNISRKDQSLEGEL